jgi:hypothetical protein
VRGLHHLVVPPPLPVELLGGPAALAVHRAEIRGRRAARYEELRLAEQLLDRLAGRKQRCEKAISRAGLR